MDDLVVKPATLATLGQALRRWLPDCAWPDPLLDGAPDAGEPAIDRSALAELTGGDAQLGREIVTRHLESLTVDFDAPCEALADGDLNRLRRHAHQSPGRAGRSVRTPSRRRAEASRLEQAAEHTADAAELERLAEGLRQTAAR